MVLKAILTGLGNMKNVWLFLLVILHTCHVYANNGDSLTIQENSSGICTMDGVVENDAAGYTGEGYINADTGINTGVSWSFNVTDAGTYKILWRYALGGSDVTSRDGGLYLNNILIDTVIFTHSGSSLWSVWLTTDTILVDLQSGLNTVRLGAITEKGLANLDYMVIYGSGLSMAECLPSFPLSVTANDSSMGSVYYSPQQFLYDTGTEITVTASPNPGYFFHSWSGVESDTASVFTFKISQKTDLTALFYENGTVADPDANCYATVQHDNGTPYLLTGGSTGETVEPSDLEELQTYLTSPEPLVVNISKHFKGSGEISVKSNKSIIGINDTAHIEGIKISIADCRNIIIKNMTFSKVITYDEIEINRAKNIWIDHCEFFTDRSHDKDYYDGLLDIKNASSFITVSWCNFHDHYKTILISSGDDSYQDSVQRITFHHNYFHDCNSRLPSIRFGKSHIFSNYYENDDDGIHTRLGACVKIEHNYFENVDGAIEQSQAFIDMELNTNIFMNSPYSTGIPSCKLEVPYPYVHLIDSAYILPTLIPLNVRIFNPEPAGINSYHNQLKFSIYPNPCSDKINFQIELMQEAEISIELFDICGVKVQSPVTNQIFNAGMTKLQLNIHDLNPGVYFCKIRMNDLLFSNKILIVDK